MNSTFPVGRSHPEAETLALFAEGRLTDPERRRTVVEHVADCAECTAVVSDAMAWLEEAEEEGEGAEVVPLPVAAAAPVLRARRRGGRIPAWAWTMAAVLSLIVLGATALLFGPQDRLHRHGDLLAADGGALLDPLTDAQRAAAANDPWPRPRGLAFSDGVSPETAAFRVGARLADARAALASERNDARHSAFGALADMLADEPEVAEVAADLENAADVPAEAKEHLTALEERLERVPEDRLPAFSLAFGRFVEAGRLAAAVGATAYFEREAFDRTLADLRQHRLGDDVHERLARVAAALEAPEAMDLREIETALTEILEVEM